MLSATWKLGRKLSVCHSKIKWYFLESSGNLESLLKNQSVRNPVLGHFWKTTLGESGTQFSVTR
jgi:hypothetical protein